MTLPDIIPDILPSLSNKNPQVKEGALKFLGRCLATATTPIQPGQLKPLTDLLGALLEDGFEGARNEAALCLGILMKMVGERPLNALMESLADVRKVKVKEAYDKATVKCKAGSGGPPKVAAAAPPRDAIAKKKTSAGKSQAATVTGDEAPSQAPVTKPPPKAAVRIRVSLGINPHLKSVDKESGAGCWECHSPRNKEAASWCICYREIWKSQCACCSRSSGHVQVQTFIGRC